MDKNNSWIVVLVIVAVAVCCCLLLITAGSTYLFMNSSQAPTETGSVKPPISEPVLPTIDLPENPLQTGTPPSVDNPHDQVVIPENILSQMQEIEKQVEKIRGLTGIEELDRKTLTQEELRLRVLNDFFADYTPEDVKNDGVILSLFGLIERDYDLYHLFIDLYSEQIAGFYDDETKEMVVVLDENFAGPERMTYAHEYTHALQDAVYGLNDGLKLDDETCEADSEYCAAVSALVEGDASLTEANWFREYSTRRDKKEVYEFYKDYTSPIFDKTPPFLKDDLIFPYSQGLDFVTSLYEKGGYEAIDNAYLNPPVSTEQILHPERYPDDKPIAIQLDDFSETLGDGWQEIDRNTLGEWYTYLFLAKPLHEDWAINDKSAVKAAEGWGGDLYLVYHNSEKDADVLISLFEWDTQGDADEFWKEVTRYGLNRFGKADNQSKNTMGWNTSDAVVSFKRQGKQFLWVSAPDEEISSLILKKFDLFN